MTRITLIEGEMPSAPIEGRVGFLLEIAPDSSLKKPYPDAIGIADLIGDFDLARAHAHRIAKSLLEGEPELRKVQQLSVFEETVIGELQHALHLINLHNVLIKGGYADCIFSGPSRFAEGLEQLTKLRKHGPQVVHPAASDSSHAGRLRRSFERLRKAHFNLESLRHEWRQALETIDFYGLRHSFRRRPKLWNENEIWFYTTAYTFTNAGLLFEPYFPQPFRYLVDNPLTGGRPLIERGRRGVDFHDFSSFSFIPRKSDVLSAQNTIVGHLRRVPLQGDDALARDLLLSGDYFSKTFLSRLLPKGLQLSRLLEYWVETVKPAAVVAGNTVFESYALLAARRRGIPTVVLQHGLFIDYCQFLDPPSDHYLVRGAFWRDFLAPSVRPKAIVVDPPQPLPTQFSAQGKKQTIVFLTQPFVLPFWHEVELDDLLTAAIETAASAKVELCVRVHPMESLAFYRTKVSGLRHALGREVQVTYSQGAGLDDILGRAAVAVTFFSTVFQDCLRHSVPIVSLDWHDFASKAQMGQHDVFYFARSLAELRQLMRHGVEGDLSGRRCSIGPFLANTPEPQLRKQILEAVKRNSRHDHATAA